MFADKKADWVNWIAEMCFTSVFWEIFYHWLPLKFCYWWGEWFSIANELKFNKSKRQRIHWHNNWSNFNQFTIHYTIEYVYNLNIFYAWCENGRKRRNFSRCTGGEDGGGMMALFYSILFDMCISKSFAFCFNFMLKFSIFLFYQTSSELFSCANHCMYLFSDDTLDK